MAALPRKQWPSSNSPARKAERRRYYERNAEKLREQSRQYRADNPKIVKALKQSYYERHREEIIQKVKVWQVANRERKYIWNRKRQLARYGLTIDEFDGMLQSQGSKCAICENAFKSTQDTHVDHDHATGLARALLCRQCNQALGHLERDGGEWLIRALAYLDAHKETTATMEVAG